MNNRDGLCFTLENSLAAVSAALKGGFVYATDGAECKVYRIAECVCGCFYTTRRPYRRLRFDPGSGGERGTALSGDCRRIFGFCGDFYETGYLEPDVPSGGYLTDANVFYSGNTRYYAVSTGESAYTYDRCGNRSALLYAPPSGAVIEDFLAISPDYFAAGYVLNGMKFVSVTQNGNAYNAAVPEDIILRMLIAGDDGIYALFGEKYVYNRITKIYSGGTITMPSGCF